MIVKYTMPKPPFLNGRGMKRCDFYFYNGHRSDHHLKFKPRKKVGRPQYALLKVGFSHNSAKQRCWTFSGVKQKKEPYLGPGRERWGCSGRRSTGPLPAPGWSARGRWGACAAVRTRSRRPRSPTLVPRQRLLREDSTARDEGSVTSRAAGYCRQQRIKGKIRKAHRRKIALCPPNITRKIACQWEKSCQL